MHHVNTLDRHFQDHSSGYLGRVPWWSFTKTVLAAASLRLVEAGTLALDTQVGEAPYTLRQLLQHEAGLPDYGGLNDYHQAVARGDDPWSTGELLERAGADRLLFAPGEGWAYSNIGYLKVGQLITFVTGQPLDVSVSGLVLCPAGANDTRLASAPHDLTDVRMGSASGYHPGWVYHGLIVGPLADATRVLRSLLAGELLSAAVLIEMCRARPLPQYRRPPWIEPGYGLGLMTPVAPGGRRVFGHTGEGPGSTIAVYGRRGPEGALVAGAWSSGEAAAKVEAASIEDLVAG